MNNFKKYPDKNDQDYKGTRYIESIFNKTDEDYQNPMKIKDTFDNN